MEKFWRDAILENVPHGEQSSLQLKKEEAIVLSELLLKKGYAVCLAGGDIGDDIRVSWIYAGDSTLLDYADYSNIVFTHIDYIDEYPQALNESLIEEDEEFEKAQDINKLKEENEQLKQQIKELKKELKDGNSNK